MSLWSVFAAVVFMIVQIIADLYLPTLTSNIINDGVAKGDINYIWSTGVVMLGFSLISIVASIGNTFFATKESQSLGKKLRTDIYRKVENFSNNEFDKFGTASLITRTTNDVNQIQMVMQMFLRLMINAPLTLIGASFMAYNKDPQLTKIFLYVLPIMAVLVGGIMFLAVPLFKSMQKKTDRLNLVFREGLTGVRVIRAFGKANYEEQRFDEANKDYTQTAIKVNTIVALMIPLMTLIMSGTNIAITWFGGHYIAEMQLEVGNLIAFMTYAMQILMSFMMLSMIFVMVPRAQASADRINEVLNTDSEIKDVPNPELLSLKGDKATLAFEHVNYRYQHAENLALEDIDFSAKSGETVAIIGGTGSGKTTLIKIINGLLKEYDGQIQVNGEKIGESSRKIISYLPDENYFQDWMYVRDVLEIFSDLYSDFDSENCLSLMNRFKLDKNMKIKAMSKGMKEKFQLCLVMSRKAKIYILDEPIAGVDPAAREVILDVILNNYEEGSLVLISTHLISDLETIFDEVIFLKEGKVVLHKETEELRIERKQSIDEAFREVFRC